MHVMSLVWRAKSFMINEFNKYLYPVQHLGMFQTRTKEIWEEKMIRENFLLEH